MLDSLSFGVILIILLFWMMSWSVIAVVIAIAKGQDGFCALLQGLTFGPVGVIFIAIPKNISTGRRTDKQVASGIQDEPRAYVMQTKSVSSDDEFYK